MGIIETGNVNFTKPVASTAPKKAKAAEADSSKAANIDKNMISAPAVSFRDVEEAKAFTAETTADIKNNPAGGVSAHVADYRLMDVMASVTA